MSKENNDKCFVLRRKGYTKGDRWGFHEYTLYNCEFTGKPLDKPETSWYKLKYAEVFKSYEEAKICKDLVDTEDVWLDIVCLRKAEEEY